MSDDLRQVLADWIDAAYTEEEYNSRVSKVREFYPDWSSEGELK